MSASPDHVKALELANQHGGPSAEVVARAKDYHAFLTGGAPAVAAAPAKASKANKEAASAAPAAEATTQNKPASAAAAKPANNKAAQAPKPAPGQTAKPAGSTKAEGGTHTFEDVVDALRRVMNSVPGDNAKKENGRVYAYKLLAEHGAGASRVSDLKPALYDAVVAACDAAVSNPPKPAAPTKAAAVVDELGGADETSVESDPPEGGSGEDI